MKYWKYVAVYQTTLLEGGPQKIIVGDTKIELLPPLPREWQIGKPLQRVAPAGRETTLAQPSVLQLKSGLRYIVITARTTEDNPWRALRIVGERVDRAITALSILFTPSILEKRVYRGWVASRRGITASTWFQVRPPVHVPNDDLPEQLERLEQRLDTDQELRSRFDLMARLYTKATAIDPSEEQFLFFWTILEVFPMKDTTNILPISEFLGRELQLPPEVIKKKLEIGRLYGHRCDLVHRGALGLDEGELGRVMSKLEAICSEVLRLYAGFGYSGRLDSYLQ